MIGEPATMIRSWLAAALLIFVALFCTNASQAACTDQGCVMAGPRLASVDSTQGALLNALLGNLTGSSVNVNVLDWQQLADGNINVAQMLNLLQTSLNVSTPSQALSANATLLQVLNAAAGATIGGNAASVAASLANVAMPLSVPVGNIVLGDLLKISGAAGQTSINALDLVMGTVQLYNHRNVVTTTTPVSLGIAGLTGVNNVTLAAQVVEPPTYTCGPYGTGFHSAAIRLKLNLTLPAQSPLLNILDGIAGVANSSVTLGSSLSVYVEVARAEGALGTINTVSNIFSAQVTPGIADLYIGSISDNVFFNRNTTISQASFTPAPFGSLSLTALFVPVTGTIGIKAYARGQLPSPTTMNFSPPYPQSQTAYTGAGFASGLLSTLLGNLQVSVTLSLLPIVNLNVLVGGVLTPVISGVLSPILSSLTNVVVDPLLNLLGIKLGEAVVSVYGTYSVCGVTGNVYSDANHNSFMDSSESGTGQTLYAKLIQTSYPTRALQVATVNTATGAYSFSNVASDSYTVLIDDSSTGSDVAVGMPTAWLPTEVPTMIRSLTVATRDVPNQNFGLFNGSKLTGRVFRDDGTGSGSIANNVVREINEAALSAVPVRATNSSGDTVYDSSVTLDDGVYTLWIPASVGAVAMKVTEVNTASFVSTGAAVGNTGGAYDRSTDTVTFTNVVGTAYANVNFGDVPANQFDTDGRQSVLPGTVAFYPHRYTAGTSGVITFAGSAPAAPGWSHSLFLDANCDGAINGADAALTGGVPVAAAQNVCVLVRVFASETAAYDAQYPLTLTATFSFANSALIDALTRNDLTVVGDIGEAGLRLSKAVDRATALPGEVLVYTITYTNYSNGPLNTIKIFDSTPAYTVFNSASCGTLALGLSGCTTTSSPSAGSTGAIEWTLAGSLLPGATGTVMFQVTIQ